VSLMVEILIPKLGTAPIIPATLGAEATRST
jgi:hypothetical protein